MVKKLQEAQKAKALWKMKAVKDAGEECCDPTREDNILERNKTRGGPQRSMCGTGQSPEVCVWKIRTGGLGPSALWRECLAMAGVGFLQSLWEKPIWEGVWHYLDPMDSVCSRTASMEWNVPGKYGPHGELFFSLIQKPGDGAGR